MRNFDKSYMKMAHIWAENSYAVRAKVGCIIVKGNQIISDGFNGTPSGFENECETCECVCTRSVDCPHADFDPEMKRHHTVNATGFYKPIFNFYDCKDCQYCVLTTKPYVLHAEANAITKCAKTSQSAEGATLYVTMSPCIECAKLIIQAGISRVVYGKLYKNEDGINLLRQAGITVEQLNETV